MADMAGYTNKKNVYRLYLPFFKYDEIIGKTKLEFTGEKR